MRNEILLKIAELEKNVNTLGKITKEIRERIDEIEWDFSIEELTFEKFENLKSEIEKISLEIDEMREKGNRSKIVYFKKKEKE